MSISKNTNLTNDEKEYYELLEDFLGSGDISESERNILNKRKEKYGISNERADEIEEFAKEERFANLKPKNDSENSYYELILDFMENGKISKNNRKILIKRMEKYGISDKRAKELKYFARNENIEKQNHNLFEQGKSYYGNGEYEKAIEYFSKAVELKPDDDKNRRWLGWSYYKNSNFILDEKRAFESLLKAVELNPNNAENWLWLGRAYHGKLKWDKSREYFLKAVELDPNNDENWHWLGRTYISFHNANKQFDFDKAIESFSKAVELNPNNAENWRWLVYEYFDNKQYNKAIESFLKAVELNPNDDESWRELGRTYNLNKQYDKAIESFLKAVELNPNNAENWRWLGFYFENLGKIEEAKEIYVKALEINPDFELIRNNLRYLEYKYY